MPGIEDLEIRIWSRNTFDVRAVQITEENIDKIGAWVGVVPYRNPLKFGDRRVITFETLRTNGTSIMNTATYGDWVTNAEGRFQRYSDKKFRAVFSMSSEKRNNMSETAKMSNLITSMTIAGASIDELARAINHSKYVMDVEKSVADNGIEELLEKYQS